MIFDSPEVQALCAKYANEPDYIVPQSVVLARSRILDKERPIIEDLILAAPERKQKDWIRRLTSEDDSQHLGAWFEIMLFGWLRHLGEVQVEPRIKGNDPDFGLQVASGTIYLEAHAVLKTEEHRKREEFESEIFDVLQQVHRSFLVSIHAIVPQHRLNRQDFFDAISVWLDQSPHEGLTYEDHWGNRVILTAEAYPDLEEVVAIGPSQPISPDPFKPALREKASQHQALRRAGQPYVLALLLERWDLSPEQVVEAWLGRHQLVIDVPSRSIVRQTTDRSGIHFAGVDIRHTTVSGTLVFKRPWHESDSQHEMRAWYVQNPFARIPVDPMIFPVQSRYVVVAKDDKTFEMGWQGPDDPDKTFHLL